MENQTTSVKSQKIQKEKYIYIYIYICEQHIYLIKKKKIDLEV
jgi:hypothetical protein